MNDELMVRADQAEIAEQMRVFGCNLRLARQSAGLTQAELSSIASLDRAAISRLECGGRAPDLPTLLCLCAALRIRPEGLLQGIGPKASPRHTRRRSGTQTSKPGAVFGANLKWARTRMGISQERLALDAKVDRAAISVYEKGGRKPNLRTVLKLALKLQIRPALLLEGIA